MFSLTISKISKCVSGTISEFLWCSGRNGDYHNKRQTMNWVRLKGRIFEVNTLQNVETDVRPLQSCNDGGTQIANQSMQQKDETIYTALARTAK